MFSKDLDQIHAANLYSDVSIDFRDSCFPPWRDPTIWKIPEDVRLTGVTVDQLVDHPWFVEIPVDRELLLNEMKEFLGKVITPSEEDAQFLCRSLRGIEIKEKIAIDRDSNTLGFNIKDGKDAILVWQKEYEYWSTAQYRLFVYVGNPELQPDRDTLKFEF